MAGDDPDHPYAAHSHQLILRDVLAIDRTRLANERTLLAWLRTALMLLISGVTLIKATPVRPRCRSRFCPRA